MVDFLRKRLEGKKVLLLGFGQEGQSSFQVIRRALPEQEICIADRNSSIREMQVVQDDHHLDFQCGDDYLYGLDNFDVIIKSPGVSLKGIIAPFDRSIITSQTDLFLQAYAPQVIGVTGTKGKSTTCSLIAHILKTAGKDTILLGNIGTPAFHFLDHIREETHIVDELSSYQLEYIHRAPHLAVLLNFYEEHLDAYDSFRDYQLAKLNIARFQVAQDVFVYNADDKFICEHLESINLKQKCVPFSLKSSFTRMESQNKHNRYLKGEHNWQNIQAAIIVSKLLDIDEETISDGVASFKGLAHRMEYVGFFHGIQWYNDSIATIPEACTAAIRSLPDVDTLILGGFDRGIGYDDLALFLINSGVKNLILMGDAGRRIGTEIEKTIKAGKKLFYINRFDDFLPIALEHTRPGATCLLSPAAASYDEFRSFEERGFRFRDLVEEVMRG